MATINRESKDDWATRQIDRLSLWAYKHPVNQARIAELRDFRLRQRTLRAENPDVAQDWKRGTFRLWGTIYGAGFVFVGTMVAIVEGIKFGLL